MRTLVYQQFDSRISPSTIKLFSSLVNLPENPSSFHQNHILNVSAYDPFHYLNKSRNLTLQETKTVHAHLLKTTAFYSNVKFPNSLLDSYSRSSANVYALKLFETIPDRDTFSWNNLISCFNRNSWYEESWKSFCRMHSLGFLPDEFTFGGVLSACIRLQSASRGKQLYSLALRNGFSSDGYVRAGMIDFLLKACSFDDALKVFNDELCMNVVCWNAMISGAVKHNEDSIALDYFSRMVAGFPAPNRFTFPSVFAACARLEQLELGRGIHGLVLKYGAEEDVFVGTAIVDFYAKCSLVDEAEKEFSRMPIRNVVSWTAIIAGFVQKGDSFSAIQFFKEMIMSREEINKYTVTSVLTACAQPAMLMEAVQIHCWIFKTGFYLDSAVKNSMITLYSKAGDIDSSEQVFGDVEDLSNPSTWAFMISSFAQNGNSDRAIDLLLRMFREGLRPDTFCISGVLSVTHRLEFGKQIHSYVLKAGLLFDVSVASSLFTMYSKCGCLKASYEVFEQIPEKDSVSWASMMAGFVEHGYPYQTIALFRDMLSEVVIIGEMILTPILAACSSIRSLKIGKEIHGLTIRQGGSENILGNSATVNMYSRCGALQLARRVFDMMTVKDQVACSSLLSGYVQSGYLEDALQLFDEILSADLKADSFTMSSVLGAVGDLNRSEIGSQLHAHITKLSLESEPQVGSSLVIMYSKCGSIDDCRKAFDQIKKPDLVSWTAMISSYAQHGKGSEALQFYELMRKSGIKPDSVTFSGVLNACSHNGLVEEGYYHLNSMVKEYGIQPGIRHYACMVDLLGRSGRLNEAEKFINDMPIEPDALVWGTLLAACKMHGDVELGKTAAEKYIELEPFADGAYVSLSNIYADMGQWEEVMNIRGEMQESGVRKEPGWSYV